jgi:hypothetical protein
LQIRGNGHGASWRVIVRHVRFRTLNQRVGGSIPSRRTTLLVKSTLRTQAIGSLPFNSQLMVTFALSPKLWISSIANAVSPSQFPFGFVDQLDRTSTSTRIENHVDAGPCRSARLAVRASLEAASTQRPHFARDATAATPTRLNRPRKDRCRAGPVGAKGG